MTASIEQHNTPYQVFGVRHHGPGSARSLVKALHAWQPDIILIEGPPEADALLALANHAEMQAPVALLIYAPEQPQQAVYYPFAEFSPEWQAIQYALQNNLPVRFMDCPVAVRFARETAEAAAEQAAEQADESSSPLPSPDSQTPSERVDLRHDPLLWLAQAAGYADSERWWEDMVEQRQDSNRIFPAITEAMCALRAETNANETAAETEKEAIREAYMRKNMRAAHKEGFKKIAVVCGAWHVPALQNDKVQQKESIKQDTSLLKGLAQSKCAATWVPWTHARLSRASGYGAGITSPGWYAHIWAHHAQAHASTDHLVSHWLTQVAQVFRQQEKDISSAHVIEAVRLSHTLAAMRDRPLAGLEEINDAIQSVMLFGDAFAMQLLDKKLMIGEHLGRIPAETPMTPLQQDLLKQQKRLRLAPKAADEILLLDLRKPNDLERSALLRQLAILNIAWGSDNERASGKGTFKESWRLQWQPEFAMQLIEAGRWGNTIALAATQFILEQAQNLDLEGLANLAQQVLYADLAPALSVLMQRLQEEAAVSANIIHLMRALPNLAHLLRYGDVRQTDSTQVATVVEGLITRICIGLGHACASLNDEAAENMYSHIQSVQEAITLLDNPDYLAAWTHALQQLFKQPSLHTLLAGRSCRLLLQANILTDAEAAQEFGLAVSLVQDAASAGAWVDGFLRDSGALLIYDHSLWQILDAWISQLSIENFQALLPVLRRTFSQFESSVRRQIGERVIATPLSMPKTRATSTEQHQQAAAALPFIAQLLGLTPTTGDTK